MAGGAAVGRPPSAASARAALQGTPARRPRAPTSRRSARPSINPGPGRRRPAPPRPAASPGPAGDPGARTPEAAAERQALFNQIAPVYDQLNDILSLGLHRVWKRMAVAWSGASPGDSALDVCCGSGDLALLLARAVTGVDYAPAMLADAAKREAAARHPRAAPVSWVCGDAMALPADDASFDAATLGYGLRNVADPAAALRELSRVLRPGGRAAVLDFNHSTNSIIDGVQAAALASLVVPAARAAGLGPQYEYLRPSILAYPTGPELETMALASGFAAARHHEVGLGLMGVLVVCKARA